MRLDRTPGGRLVSILQGGVLPCLGLLLALLPGRSAAQELAQELYVSDYREVPVWLSPSPDSEVFATLKTGDAVQRVHEEGEYYLAVLPNGRRGYVLRRDVTQDAPAAVRLERLEAEVEQQREEIAQLRQKNNELTTATTAQTDRETRLKTELEQLKSERGQTEHRRNLSWFLAGAGVLLTGWLIGWRFKLRDGRRGQGLRFS